MVTIPLVHDKICVCFHDSLIMLPLQGETTLLIIYPRRCRWAELSDPFRVTG